MYIFYYLITLKSKTIELFFIFCILLTNNKSIFYLSIYLLLFNTHLDFKGFIIILNYNKFQIKYSKNSILINFEIFSNTLLKNNTFIVLTFFY